MFARWDLRLEPNAGVVRVDYPRTKPHILFSSIVHACNVWHSDPQLP
jgi:hypothetical protein